MLPHEMKTDEPPEYDAVEYPDLPDGWEWRMGESGDTSYTRWFGTEYRMGGSLAGVHGMGGYDGQVYWDAGSAFHVEIIPIVGGVTGDDPIFGYPVSTEIYPSLQDALDAVPKLIEGLGG